MKNIFSILILITFIVFISGCSNNKQPNPPQSSVDQSVKYNSNPDEAFLNEFEDEIKVKKQSDPFEGYNRVMTTFNDRFYTYILIPIANGYRTVTHQQVRASIANFFSNIFFPVSFANNILQGKITYATTELGRFVINSTFGVLGLFDPAKTQLGWEAHKEDFGQTLGVWGFGSGPHIVLPILGPSNVRDIVGSLSDSFVDPVYYDDGRNYNLVDKKSRSIAVKFFQQVNYRAIHKGEYEKMKEDAIDLYPYLKNLYEQYRNNQIKE